MSVEAISEEEKRARAAALGFARRDREIAELKTALSQAEAERDAALARNKELEEALEWYAEWSHYKPTTQIGDFADYETAAVIRDGGRRARSVYGGE